MVPVYSDTILIVSRGHSKYAAVLRSRIPSLILLRYSWGLNGFYMLTVQSGLADHKPEIALQINILPKKYTYFINLIKSALQLPGIHEFSVLLRLKHYLFQQGSRTKLSKINFKYQLNKISSVLKKNMMTKR